MHFKELAAITGGTLYNSVKADEIFTGVSIDSRSVKHGELFIAINGGNHDGHDFICQAIDNGAAGIISEFSYPGLEHIRGDIAVVAVSNSHQAMIKLAKKYRDSIDSSFIGITGSNGKTTTKELTYRLIKKVENNTHCSPGNFNNLFGVPLALFSIPKDARVVVLELGISSHNEMPQLAEIVQPELVIITNVGPSHLEFLDSVEDVARAKLELVKRASADIPVIVNADDKILISEIKKIRSNFVTFALENKADFIADSIDMSNLKTIQVTIDNNVFNLPLFGKHQVYNLLAAYAAFKTLGYSFDKINTSQISLDTAPMRGQIVVKKNITFIVDCYNANPDSVKAGLMSFFNIQRDSRRIIILGDMLELGKDSQSYHREIGRLLINKKFDTAILIGPMTVYIMDEAIKSGTPKKRFIHFDSSQKAISTVKDSLRLGDIVYVKGSRGIGLEKVLNAFDSREEPH